MTLRNAPEGPNPTLREQEVRSSNLRAPTNPFNDLARKRGERVKTDRRDCRTLARRDRAGESMPVWVSDAAQEAMRDLSRAREDMAILGKQLRQRLAGFPLRHGRRYSGRRLWTHACWPWKIPRREQWTSPEPFERGQVSAPWQ